MRVLVAFLLAVLAVSGAGAVARAPGLDQGPLVRLFEGGRAGDELVLVDPRTLRPASRRVRTFRDGFGGTFSPDGTLFAYGNGFDRRSIVHLIAVAGWHTQARLDLGDDGPVALSWPTEERLIAITGEAFGTQRLFVAAMPEGQVLARHRFRGRRLADASSPRGLVVLLAPDRGLGPARLLLADVDGGLRSVEIERIRAGGNEGSRRNARFRVPAITVDPEAGVAYVVAAGPALVARVDLASGAVTYHRLRNVGGVPRATAAKGSVAAWWREASWLGDGRLALTGHYEPPFRPRRPRAAAPRPFGVRLVDTRDWTLRTMHPGAMFIHRAGAHLLATGTDTGLLAFDARGRRRFTRFRGRDVSLLGSHGELAYVWVRRERMLHVIDLGSGRTLRADRTPPGRLPFLFSGAPSQG